MSQDTRRQKPSRMEKQIRNQARGLFWVSALLLVACATMTGMFGWSMGRTGIEKFVFAMGLVAADLAGAYLIATSGTCAASKEVWAARKAMMAAGVCCILTFTGIVGFQSESREGQVQSRERAIGMSDSFVEWSKTTTGTAVAQAKGRPSETFVLGIKEVGKAVKDQIGMLQSGELAGVADGQATTFGRLTGMSEASTRSWAISGTSGALLFIQYACLWFYGFLRHRLEPIVAAQSLVSSSQFSAEKAASFANHAIFTDAQARDDLTLLLRGGFQVDKYGAYSYLARRFGWSPNRTIRWLRQQADVKIPPPAKRAERKTLDRGADVVPILNGHARASGNA